MAYEISVVMFATLGQHSDTLSLKQGVWIGALSLLWPVTWLFWLPSILAALRAAKKQDR